MKCPDCGCDKYGDSCSECEEFLLEVSALRDSVAQLECEIEDLKRELSWWKPTTLSTNGYVDLPKWFPCKSWVR